MKPVSQEVEAESELGEARALITYLLQEGGTIEAISGDREPSSDITKQVALLLDASIRASQVAAQLEEKEREVWCRALAVIHGVAKQAAIGGPVDLACVKIAERFEIESARTNEVSK